MAWLVQLDFNDGNGWREITDYVLTDTFVRDRSLWTELQPNINTCRFEMLWEYSIVTLLLNASGEVDVNIKDDTVDYFTGIVRTNWHFSVTTRPQTVKIECVDKGILLKEKRVTPVTPALWEGYRIVNNGDTDSSLLHQLLYSAGFTSDEINLTGSSVNVDEYFVDGYFAGHYFPTGYLPQDETLLTNLDSEVDYFRYIDSGRTYWDVISTLLYEFHHIFYFNESGQFCAYNWSPDEVTIGDTLDNTNMVGELTIKKTQEKYEAMQVRWYPRETLSDQIVFSDTTDGNQTHKCSIILAAGEFYPTGSDAHAVYADYKVEDREVIAVKDAYVDKIIGDSISENVFTSYYTKAQLEYENKADLPEYIYKLDIVGDAVVKGDLNVTKRENTSGTDKLLDYEAEYIATEAVAQRLTRALGRYYEYSDFSYSVRSKVALDPGDFVTVAETSFLKISNDCVVVGRSDNEKTGEHFYTLEGISEYNAGDTVSAGGGVAHPYPKQSRYYMVVAASGYAGSADYYCDGVEDEVQINAALGFAWENDLGTVHLVGGTFYTSGSIIMVSGLKLDMNGCTVNKASGATSVISIGGCDKIIIENGTITKTTGDVAGLDIVSSSNVLVRSCTFNALYASVGIGVGNTDVIIENNTMGTSEVVNIESTINNKGIRIVNNYILGAGTSGITAYGSNVEIVNNQVTGCLSSGIATDIGKHNFVKGNTVWECGQNIVGAGPAAGIVVAAEDELVSGNYAYDNGNMLSYSTCENETYPPQIDGNSASNASAARSGDTSYAGSYSYKITKDVAAGTSAYYRLVDGGDTSDMHGLVAGETYRFSMRMLIPTDGIEGSRVLLIVRDYQGGWESSSEGPSNAFDDQWQEVEIERTIRASATGVDVWLYMGSSAELNDYFYIDNVRMVPLGLSNGNSTNFIDNGDGTVVSGNSWQ